LNRGPNLAQTHQNETGKPQSKPEDQSLYRVVQNGKENKFFHLTGTQWIRSWIQEKACANSLENQFKINEEHQLDQHTEHVIKTVQDFYVEPCHATPNQPN
ncbi:hypothetical protein NPIL_66231, partial [Nephila pilipes]